MSNEYSIEYTIGQSDRWNGPGDPEGTAGTALKAIGLTKNATGSVTRVRVSHKSSGSWGVDVPTERAEEFAKQLWKDSRTSRVSVSEKEFPKPVERTAEDVQKEFDAFKLKVLALAIQTKREEGWCDEGFKRAMKDLGLEVPARKVRIVLEMDLDEVAEDADVNPDDFNAVKNFLHWGIDYGAIADSVVSTEPIKD